MSMLIYLLRGLALGFAIAAPVGPIGVLCIRRTLADGRLMGFVTGLGAATADATYGAVAAFGVSAVAAALVGLRLWIHLLGAVFLAWLGRRTLLARTPTSAAAISTAAATTEKPATETAATETAATETAATETAAATLALRAPAPRGLLATWATTVALTLTNPTTILSFAAVFAGLGLAGAPFAAAGLMVVGVFLGSALWWFVLSGGVNLLRARFDTRTLRWVNVVSGLLLLGFAVFALASLAPGR